MEDNEFVRSGKAKLASSVKIIKKSVKKHLKKDIKEQRKGIIEDKQLMKKVKRK